MTPRVQEGDRLWLALYDWRRIMSDRYRLPVEDPRSHAVFAAHAETVRAFDEGLGEETHDSVAIRRRLGPWAVYVDKTEIRAGGRPVVVRDHEGNETRHRAVSVPGPSRVVLAPPGSPASVWLETETEPAGSD